MATTLAVTAFVVNGSDSVCCECNNSGGDDSGGDDSGGHDSGGNRQPVHRQQPRTVGGPQVSVGPLHRWVLASRDAHHAHVLRGEAVELSVLLHERRAVRNLRREWSWRHRHVGMHSTRTNAIAVA